MTITNRRPIGDELDWENNKISNSMAWVSLTVAPNWCHLDNHWTIRFADKLWAECSCCAFFRGVMVGAFLGACTAGLLGLVVGALLF